MSQLNINRLTKKRIRHLRVRAGVVAFAASLSVPAQTSASGTVPPDYAGIGLFDIPTVVANESKAVNFVSSGNLESARKVMDALVRRYPETPKLWVTRALVAALSNNPNRAVQFLRKANEFGATNLGAVIASPPFAKVASDPRVQDLADRPGVSTTVPPHAIANGQAIVSDGNSNWDRNLSRIRSHFSFDDALSENPALAGDKDPSLARLRELVAEGLAAGNAGDLYDNRDDGHSRIPKPPRSQLSFVTYGKDAKRAGIHYGLNTQILFDAPTFGNSSTAVTGKQWRSLPRLALTTPGGAARLWQLYNNNHIYVFPEHRDHDPQSGKGRGDLLPANNPYYLISQGSSGSDQPFLRAIRAILAAFKPAVKERLIAEKLIAPTVQQIFRRGMRGIHEDDYLTGKAHPTVFEGKNIDLAKMIDLAQGIDAESLPPVILLRMSRETPIRAGVFANGLSEKTFDTPGSIARTWRGPAFQRLYELFAEATDPNGREVEIRWRVLRGDPDRVKIESGDDGRSARIRVEWQDARPVPGRPEISSTRVDVAAFAYNGVQLSAPAFFSIQFPTHQKRKYDQKKRLLALDHNVGRQVYVDPVQWPSRDWRDEFSYSDDGELLGWIRLRQSQRTRFSSHGLRVLTTDQHGRALTAQAVHYPIEAHGQGTTQVIERVLSRTFTYTYKGTWDRIGTPTPD